MNNIERESVIIDYLNGHLSQHDAQQFEQAVASDTELQAQLESARFHKTAVAENNTVSITPQFEQFRKKLDKPSILGKNWIKWVSLPAAVAFVALLSISLKPVSVNEFETLSSASAEYQVAAMRLIAMPKIDVVSVAQEYNLHVLNQYPNASAVDVAVPENSTESIQDLRNKLQQDKRLLLVKALNE